MIGKGCKPHSHCLLHLSLRAYLEAFEPVCDLWVAMRKFSSPPPTFTNIATEH